MSKKHAQRIPSMDHGKSIYMTSNQAKDMKNVMETRIRCEHMIHALAAPPSMKDNVACVAKKGTSRSSNPVHH